MWNPIRTARPSVPLMLICCVAFIAALAGCNDAPTDPVDTSFGAIEQSAHAKINTYRASKGLSALEFNETIAAQARAHSADMAAGRVAFSHDGFDARVAAIAKVISVSGAAENVAFNNGFSDPASEAVTGWLNSSGHRANIEGDYDLTGIGVARAADGAYYFTQIFVKR
jgi:uncharacterized protein YkwD